MRYNFITPVIQCWDRTVEKYGTGKFYFTFLTGLIIVGFAELLYPGIPAGHDLGFHLSRIAGDAKGFQHGFIPPWINFDAINQMGYGAGLFYSDIYLFLPALLVALGLPIILAYKLFLLTWGLLTGWSMYYAAYKISGRNGFAGFAAALLYVWSSYFATDVFNRAAIGEVMAFLFIPWILLGLYNIIYEKPYHFLPLTLGFAGLFYAHSISFVLMSLATLLLIGLNFIRFFKDIRRVGYLIFAGILSAGIAAFGIVPMFEQLGHLKFNLTGQTMASPIADFMVPVTRLFLELPYMKLENWIPPGIGMIFVIVAVQRLRLARRGSDACQVYADHMLIAAGVSLLCATNFLPWEGMMRVLASIQFPWRFYLLATAFGALGGGLILERLTRNRSEKQRFWSYILICGCGFAWFFNIAYVYAAKTHEKQMFQTFDRDMVQLYSASGQHYLPQGVKLATLRESKPAVTPLGNFAAGSVTFTPGEYGKYLLDIRDLKTAGSLTLPITPYWGYSARSGATPIEIRLTQGNFEVVIPQAFSGQMIEISYINTRAQKISFAISLICVILTLVITFKRYQFNMRKI